MDTLQHTPSPTGKGVFWAIRQDWNLPICLGAFFIIGTVAAILPYFIILDKNQKRTYAVVASHLRTLPLREVPEQRSLTLSDRDGVFYWRGLVWKEAGETYVPHIFAIKVDTRKDYSITETELFNYEEEKAWDYGVFTELK